MIVLEFDRAGISAARALPEGLPSVVAGGGSRRAGHVPAALIDERTAGRQATEYLLHLGHQTVHHIAGPTEGKHSGRTDGWRAALEGRRRPGAAGDARRMGRERRLPLGRAARREGRRHRGVLRATTRSRSASCAPCPTGASTCPADISMIGFDDQPLVALWRPALTTVDQDFEDLGARAFGLLLRQTEGETDLPASVATPELVIRESTAPPPPR